ncbi:MAG TPA: hypothetical protein VFK37_06315 [Bacillales bacterium]|nr:hypothetical protein [Bacillales bacterium]
MEQKNRISIRINGKEKTKTGSEKQTNSVKKEKEFHWVLPEENSTARVVPLKPRHPKQDKRKKSSGQAPGLPFHRKKKRRGYSPRKRKNRPSVPKKQWVSAFSAVVVGVLMGMIVLSIFTVQHHTNPTTDTPASETAALQTSQSPETDNTAVSADNLDLTLQIVQGAAFSTKAHGQTAANELKNSGFAAVLNQANQSIHLFIGVGLNKGNTEALGKVYKQHGQNVYVKTFPIQVNGGQLNGKVHKFLGEAKPVLVKLIQGSVEGLISGDTGLSNSEWNELQSQVKQIKNDSTQETQSLMVDLTAAVNAFGTYRDQSNPSSLWQVQQALLDAVLSYRDAGK